jgi:hypothetical protein
MWVLQMSIENEYPYGLFGALEPALSELTLPLISAPSLLRSSRPPGWTVIDPLTVQLPRISHVTPLGTISGPFTSCVKTPVHENAADAEGLDATPAADRAATITVRAIRLMLPPVSACSA